MADLVQKHYTAMGLQRSLSPNLSKSWKSSSPMHRSTGNIQSSLRNGNIESLEAEYIKNLQQQIYLLEMEANYLREQAKKAADLHPQMSAEAKRMLAKLRSMQAEMDGLQMEKKRIENNIDIITKERNYLMDKLREEEEAQTRDKNLLMESIMNFKKDMSQMESEMAYKDNQLMKVKNDLSRSDSALTNAEGKLTTLKVQLLQQVEQQKVTQLNLKEKRTELISLELQMKALEQKYYNNQDTLVSDLHNEIHDLRQQLKEAEMRVEHEHHLRTKLSDENSTVMCDNATLHQHILETAKQLEKEKNLHAEMMARHEAGIRELFQCKEREKEVRFELEHVTEQLRNEQERVNQCLEQASYKDSIITQQEHQLNTAHSRITELSNMNQHQEKENTNLHSKNSVLVNHVSELQMKLEHKNEEVVNLRSQVLCLNQRVEELEQINNLESSSQSQKWSEFERLAESMKTLSHTMAVTMQLHSPQGIPTPHTQSPGSVPNKQ